MASGDDCQGLFDLAKARQFALPAVNVINSSTVNAVLETAKAEGKVASLLDQERPNIFTQSVANIEPGEKVEIEIAYSETLDWKAGEYHFDFPMVVGPRYMPGTPSGGVGTASALAPSAAMA